MDRRHKRVQKACERCRMKKTKCDGELPCKRCKDHGLVCTAGFRKKTEFRKLPQGYAEVLEHTQLTLVATIQRLYNMVRNNESWDLGEPGINERGTPIIHRIAHMLRCLRPDSDVNIPIQAQVPETEEDLANLARKLEDMQELEYRDDRESQPLPMAGPDVRQQRQRLQRKMIKRKSRIGDAASTDDGITDRGLSSEPDHSNFRAEYRNNASGRTKTPRNTTPLNLATTRIEMMPSSLSKFPTDSNLSQPTMPMSWEITKSRQPPSQQPFDHFLRDQMQENILFSQELFEHIHSMVTHDVSCVNSEAMLSKGDPVFFSNLYDVEAITAIASPRPSEPLYTPLHELLDDIP